MYDYTSDNWSHRNSNEKLKGKCGSCSRKTFDRLTTKDSCTWNFTRKVLRSLLILSSLVYPVTLLRKRISAASRRVISLFVVAHVSLPYSSDGLATTL